MPVTRQGSTRASQRHAIHPRPLTRHTPAPDPRATPPSARWSLRTRCSCRSDLARFRARRRRHRGARALHARRGRRSVDRVVEAAREAAELGIPAICLFPTPAASRTPTAPRRGTPTTSRNRATRAIKAAVPGIAVMTDVALDPYSDTGHDGFVRRRRDRQRRNRRGFGQTGAQQAEAGVDIIGPSDMMDGRIGAIRSRSRLPATTMSCCSATRQNTPVPSMARSAMRSAPRAP